MSRIIRCWDLRDFCYSHGRIIPHTKGNSDEFTSFHCADKSHDDSETVYCSEGIGICHATMVGILTMSGTVVEFDDKEGYYLFTKSEVYEIQRQEKIDEAVEEIETTTGKVVEKKEGHPAKPAGVKITPSIQDISYKSYCRCPDYHDNMLIAQSAGS